MPIAQDPNKPFEYVLKADRGTERPTRWLLKPLTVREEADLRDGIMQYAGGASVEGRVLAGSIELKTLKLGLVGCEDFYDAAGNAVPFEDEPDNKRHPTRRVVTDGFLSWISRSDRTELAEAIAERNRVTEDEEKN